MALNDPLFGKKLGDYKIESLLGKGGMARVYKGYDENLDRYAAVKVISAEFIASDEEEYTERFQREARSIARLRHPHIVGVYQFGKAEDLYYMAMVFLDGEDLRFALRNYASKGQRMPVEEVLKMASEIADSLDYAHKQGVIHRDIKPSNIMMTSRGAVLTDFGLALSTAEGTMGDTFGSAHYIAPEQAVSSARAVPQSDLYSLGIVIYESLAGTVPFDDPSAMSVALKHLNEPPPPIRRYNPDLTEDLEKVLLKVLSKEPKERFESGKELIEALYGTVDKAPEPIVRKSESVAILDNDDTFEVRAETSSKASKDDEATAEVTVPEPESGSSLENYLSSLKEGSYVKRPSLAKNILSDIISDTQAEKPTGKQTTKGKSKSNRKKKNAAKATTGDKFETLGKKEERRRGGAIWIVAVIVLLLVAAGAFLALSGGDSDDGDGSGGENNVAQASEQAATDESEAIALQTADAATEIALAAEQATDTPVPTDTEEVPTDTPEPTDEATDEPTDTAEPSATFTREPTNTPTITTPTPNQTSTALALEPPDIRLEYTDGRFLLTNVSDDLINVGTLTFEGDQNGVFYGVDWQGSLQDVGFPRSEIFNIRADGCMQLTIGRDDYEPSDCRWYNIWVIRIGEGSHFWQTDSGNEKFFVYTGTGVNRTLVTECEISAEVCEFAFGEEES